MESSKPPNERLEKDFATWINETNALLKSCVRIKCSEDGLHDLSKSAFFAGAEAKRILMVEDIAVVMIKNLAFLENKKIDLRKGVSANDFIEFFDSLHESLQTAIRKIALEEMEETQSKR
jgi:hypothetical protein